MAGQKTTRGKSKKPARGSTAVNASKAPKRPPQRDSSDALLEALHNREEQLSFVLEAADLGIWDWDIASNKLVWSPRCLALFGLAPDTAMTYEKFLDAVHPDDRKQVDTAVNAALSDHRDYDQEMRAVWPDGSLHWISSRGRAYYDEKGQAIRMAGAALDITERKVTSEALRESEERLQLFIEHAPAALAMFDRRMRYIVASERWKEDYGIQGRKLRGVSHYEVFPEIPEVWKEAHRRGLAGERLRADADRFDRADGSIQWLRWEIHPWHDSCGGVGGIVIFSEDITARKMAQDAAAEAHARTQRVLTSIMQGYYRLDENWRIVEMNPFAERYFGRKLADWGDKTIWEILGTPSHHIIRLTFEQAQASRRKFQFEIESQAHPGAWSRIYLYPHDGGLEVYFHDVTQQKLAEIERDRSTKQRQLALDAAKLGWWHYDPVLKMATYDEGYRNIFQVDGDRGPNEEMLKRLHPDDVPGVWARVEAALNPHDPKPYEAQYRILLPDGSFRWIEAHGVATFKGEGDERRATSLVGTVADITERKLADSRLRRFFETDLFALLYWRIDGAVLDANDKFLQITGYSREDLLSGRLNWSEMTPPEFQQADEDARRQVRETGVHRPYEKQYVRKDGRRVWVEVSAAAWEDNRNEGVSFILDITERKRTEEALLTSEAQFRDLANAIPQLCWMANEDGWLFWYNQRWYEYTGTTPEQMEGWGWQSVHDPETLPLVLDRWKASIASGQPFDMVFPLRRFDGVFRPFLTRIMPVRDSNGKIVRWFGTNTDVAELRDAQEALRISEEKFATAFAANPAAIALTRLQDGVFLEVNDTWTKLTHWNREEVVGVPSMKLRIWADPRQRETFVAKLLQEHSLSKWQPEFKKKTGESFFAELSAQILTIGGEEVVLSTLIDVTERKRAEEGLRLSNERFQVALKNSSVVVFNQDLDLRYTWIYNPSLGYDAAEVIGKRDGDLFGKPQDAVMTEAIKREVIRTGIPQRREVIVHWEGAERYYDLQVDPLRDATGEVVGVTCAAIDVTDRKRAEAAMLRSEKLASVGRMAATVAHEINNPLEAVMNSIFLAQIEKSPGEMRKHLKNADEELRRVAHIARQSLGFYRDRAEPACTSAAMVLSSAVDLLKNKIRGKEAVIRTECDPDLCVHVVANELRQVFGNLVANSLDAIGQGGTIVLRTRRYTRPNGGPGVRITVADNGSGIDPEARGRVFEPLFTTKNDVGTGLGLWVSKQIVEKHGGTVRVRSRCDGTKRGTTITICMPECTQSSR